MGQGGADLESDRENVRLAGCWFAAGVPGSRSGGCRPGEGRVRKERTAVHCQEAFMA